MSINNIMKYTEEEIKQLLNDGKYDEFLDDDNLANFVTALGYVDDVDECFKQVILNQPRLNQLLLNSDNGDEFKATDLYAVYPSSEPFWNHWFDEALKFKPTPMINKECIMSYFYMELKPNSFRKVLFERIDEIHDVLKVYGQTAEVHNKIIEQMIDNMSKDERKNLVDILHKLPGGKFHVDRDALKKLSANDIEVALKILNEKGYTHAHAIQIGKLFKTVSEKKINDTIKKAPASKASNQLLSWYFAHSEISVIDEEIIDVIIENKWSANDVAGKLSREQLDKLMATISLDFESIVSNEHITVEELSEMVNGKKHNVLTLDSRFFKEEEIVKQPNLFKLTRNYSFGIFMSESTVKLLNETWGTDVTWNKMEHAKFSTILLNMNPNSVNFENIDYLISKTNASNAEVLDLFSYVHEDGSESSLRWSINIVKGLMQ